MRRAPSTERTGATSAARRQTSIPRRDNGAGRLSLGKAVFIWSHKSLGCTIILRKVQGKTRESMNGTRQRGQALTEFVVVLGLLLATGTILALFLVTFREYGGRVLHLLAADLP